MNGAGAALDRLAADVPYEALSRTFLEFDRFPGECPLLIVAQAAASTTGRDFHTGVIPTVSAFRETFVDTGRITSFADVRTIDRDDEDFTSVFGAKRMRRVYLEIATSLDNRSEDDDFDALTSWASAADHYRYDEDPIGSLRGVGPSTFQYLRMLAGVDTARPDATLTTVIADIASTVDSAPLDVSTPLRTIASCEWLAVSTEYRQIDIDRIAWWHGADEDERAAELSLSRS